MNLNRNSIRMASLSLFLVAGSRERAFALVGPCDLYATGGTACIAAHSTVRALYGAYADSLYQVRRSSDSTMKNIGALTAGGAANSALQDQFCTGTTCVITKIYDQSGHGNFMEYQGSGSSVTGSASAAVATTEKFQLGGQNVYSLYIKPGNTYWRDGSKSSVPTGTAPEAMYMVTSGKHYNSGCCFDYGNSEIDRKADGAGAMDAIYFGSSCWFSSTSSYKCNTGSGPWVQADLEYGLFASNSSSAWNSKEVSFTSTYVTAMLKNNGTNRMALKGGNAQSGGLTTIWDGALPYSKMAKQGAIVLGSGGDCCREGGGVNQSEGTFYEGAIVAGYPSDAVDSSIHANVLAAGYGRTTTGILDGKARWNPSASLRYDPTTGTAIVEYAFENPGSVRIRVLDLEGREVAKLVDGSVSSGRHEVSWSAGHVRAGIYSVVIEGPDRQIWTGKIVAAR